MFPRSRDMSNFYIWQTFLARVYLRSNMALLGFPQWRKHWHGIKIRIWSSLNIPVVSVRSQNLRVVPPPPSRFGDDSIGLSDFTSEKREKNNKIKMFTWFSKTNFWKRNDQPSKRSEEMKKTKILWNESGWKEHHGFVTKLGSPYYLICLEFYSSINYLVQPNCHHMRQGEPDSKKKVSNPRLKQPGLNKEFSMTTH